MTLPNFLVIGAQKCGTTALYMALRQHPQIYMSLPKEPRFFAFAGKAPNFCGPGSALFNQGVIHRSEVYAALFTEAKADQAIGEASPIYLSSYQPAETAEQIHSLLPHVRLIAILRQPAERSWSAFLHHRRLGIEPLSDFRQALSQEAVRVAQHWYPGWRYQQNSLYAANLQPYFTLFDRQQIQVYLYEEWDKNPQGVLRSIFGFLGIDNRVKIKTERANVTFTYRHLWLHHLLDQPNQSRRIVGRGLRSHLGQALYQGLRAYNQLKPSAIDPALRKELTAHYCNDIVNLQALIERDLSHWLSS